MASKFLNILAKLPNKVKIPKLHFAFFTLPSSADMMRGIGIKKNLGFLVKSWVFKPPKTQDLLGFASLVLIQLKAGDKNRHMIAYPLLQVKYLNHSQLQFLLLMGKD